MRGISDSVYKVKQKTSSPDNRMLQKMYPFKATVKSMTEKSH